MAVSVFPGRVSPLIMAPLRSESALYKPAPTRSYPAEPGEKWLIGMLAGEDGTRRRQAVLFTAC